MAVGQSARLGQSRGRRRLGRWQLRRRRFPRWGKKITPALLNSEATDLINSNELRNRENGNVRSSAKSQDRNLPPLGKSSRLCGVPSAYRLRQQTENVRALRDR